MTETLTAGWSREYFLTKMVKKYTDLVEYWSQPYRQIGKSDRLDQSKEFITNQLNHCLEKLVQYREELAIELAL